MATSSFVDASKQGRVAQLQKLIKRERGNVILPSSAPASNSDKNIEKNIILRQLPSPMFGSEYVCLSSSCVHPYMALICTLSSIIRQFLFSLFSLPPLIGNMLMTSAVISDFLLIFIPWWPEQSQRYSVKICNSELLLTAIPVLSWLDFFRIMTKNFDLKGHCLACHCVFVNPGNTL